MEALSFLKKKRSEFAANMFDHKSALGFCKKLYALGAINIDIPFSDDLNDKEIYSDKMVISLPKSLGKRLDILATIIEYYPDEISSSEEHLQKMNWRTDNKVMLWWD